MTCPNDVPKTSLWFHLTRISRFQTHVGLKNGHKINKSCPLAVTKVQESEE